MIWRVAATVGLLTGVLALPATGASPPSSVRIQDDRIKESSALVDLGSGAPHPCLRALAEQESLP